MSELPIATRDDAGMTFSYTEAANQIRELALVKSALIGHVRNADEQKQAVEALQEIANALSVAEKAREAAKQPVIQFGRKIDATAKDFVADLIKERNRLNQEVGDFQMLEDARIRAAQRAENERLSAIERAKAKELSKAESHEELEAIQEKYNQAALEASTMIAPPARAEGQRVVKDWTITVTDIWLLARAHPMCVNIEPRLSEIKSLLKAGVKVAGVTAVLVTKNEVRAKQMPPALNV